jgi:hypothetical protein
MICSRCDRAPTHGGMFVEVEEHVFVCGRCFTESTQIEPVGGYERAPARRCAKVPPEFLAKLGGKK